MPCFGSDPSLTMKLLQVCDLKSPFDEGQFCDAACGGGGCDKCGEGDSCTEGAQGKLTSAVKVTERAKMAAGNKSEEALTKLGEVSTQDKIFCLIFAFMASLGPARETLGNLSLICIDCDIFT